MSIPLKQAFIEMRADREAALRERLGDPPVSVRRGSSKGPKMHRLSELFYITFEEIDAQPPEAALAISEYLATSLDWFYSFPREQWENDGRHTAHLMQTQKETAA